MVTADILIIGGGVAGLSAAAALSSHARVIVLEAEEQAGFHSSGRSATMLHYALGNPLIRELTRASRPFFDEPPAWFGELVGTRLPVLVHARESERAEIDRLESELALFAPLERIDASGLRELCPLLKVGPGGAEHGIVDRHGLKLDGHALLQGYLRGLRQNRGELHASARIASVARRGDKWAIETERRATYVAPVLINAAGSWADAIAGMAGVAPIGLEPRKRTIITFDAPPGTEVGRLPFTKTVGDELYFGAEGGRLFASPMDEEPSDPCDAQADEYAVALAAHRMEERTTVRVERIAHRWAGLRSFAPDGNPVIGFAPDADSFFWLAGQGGAGLQTSPAIARIACSLITGSPWPVPAVTSGQLSPARLVGQAA